MDQLPLEDVVVLAQMGAPHPAGVIAVCKASFHQLAIEVTGVRHRREAYP